MLAAVNFREALATDFWSPKNVGKVNDQFIKVAKLKLDRRHLTGSTG